MTTSGDPDSLQLEGFRQDRPSTWTDNFGS